MSTVICRTLGDLILDVVMKVFTGTVSGMLSSSLGLSHGRSSGSFMDTVIRSVRITLLDFLHSK